MWVVVGLGNPGRRYVRTRHNVGFRVVDLLAGRWSASVTHEAHGALLGDVRRGGERVLLVKPQSFMNGSGDPVARVRRFYRVALEHLVAVHDDVDLEVGRVRLRQGGRAGGNRGIASMIDVLGNSGFVRVKVGVGRPPAGAVRADYVLGVPPAEEGVLLTAAEGRAADAVELLVTDGPQRAMNQINQREAMHGGPPL